MFKYSFQIYLFVSDWIWIDLSKEDSPNTSKKVLNDGAEIQSAGVDHFWMPSSTPNWDHDSSVEINSSLFFILLINKVIWALKLWENLILPRSLQQCSNSPVIPVSLTLIQNHDTCVKMEGIFSSLTYDRKKPLSLLYNSSPFFQKHSLNKN